MARILVVDDEENVRLLYTMELKDEGYDVITATTAEEALDIRKEQNPDLIILDIRLPGMNGIEFLRRVKEIKRDIPVLMCTAYDDYKQDFGVWASEAYIVKSSDLSELKSKIKEFLKWNIS